MRFLCQNISDLNDEERVACANNCTLVIEGHGKMRHKNGINIDTGEDDDENEDLLVDFTDKDSQLSSRRGAKTVSASHLKQCMHKNGGRKRKAEEGDGNENKDKDVNRARMDLQHSNGRRSGKGRGMKGGTRLQVKELDRVSEKFTHVNVEARETKIIVDLRITPLVRDFDFNMELDESGHVAGVHLVVKQEDRCLTDIASVDFVVKVEDQYPSNVESM
eukprot:Gb_05333 [translate_table: standard]